MTDPARQPSETSFADAAVLRAITIDELAGVRYLHDLAIRRLAVSHLTPDELAAFSAYVKSDRYTERLVEQVRNNRLLGAMLMGELVATSGWVPANDSGAVARLMAVFVHPLYVQTGLGRLVVTAAEVQAQRAGYKVFTIRAPIGAVGFFARLGYEVASHGVWTLPPSQAMPVGFMRKVAAEPAPPH